MYANVKVNSIHVMKSPTDPNHVATKEYVDMKKNELIGEQTPETLNTLGKISKFIGSTSDVSTTIIAMLDQNDRELEQLKISMYEIINKTFGRVSSDIG